MDMEVVVDKLEEFGLIRKNKRIGNYMSIYCPIHNSGQEKKPSCGILMHSEYRNGVNYPEGFTHCFSCQFSGDLKTLVTKLLEINNISASANDWLKENIPGYDDSEFERLIPQDMADIIQSKLAVNDILARTNQSQSYVPEEELAKYRYTVPYMYERKLTDEIIARYDIGVDMNWIPSGKSKPVPCITFPVHDRAGNTLFLVRRAIERKLYHMPEGVQKPVYGLDQIPYGCRSVIICESCINALTLAGYGYNAVALLGTGTPYQIQQLKELGPNEFVICMDGDEAGRRATDKLKKQLKNIAIIWTIHMPDGKDANDCTREEFEQLYAERD